jgi:hypothetical protein
VQKECFQHQLPDRRILSVEGMFVKIFEISTPYEWMENLGKSNSLKTL